MSSATTYWVYRSGPSWEVGTTYGQPVATHPRKSIALKDARLRAGVWGKVNVISDEMVEASPLHARPFAPWLRSGGSA